MYVMSRSIRQTAWRSSSRCFVLPIRLLDAHKWKRNKSLTDNSKCEPFFLLVTSGPVLVKRWQENTKHTGAGRCFHRNGPRAKRSLSEVFLRKRQKDYEDGSWMRWWGVQARTKSCFIILFMHSSFPNQHSNNGKKKKKKETLAFK